MTVDTGPIELIAILAIVALIAIPVLLLLALLRYLSRPAAPDPAVILNGRLARGEITPDEFETAMTALGYRKIPPARP